MFQRVRLVVLFVVNAPPITTATVPVVRMVRRGKAVASRFGGPSCSARDLSKRFWSYAGLSFDAEQGCWWSVCIHRRSRYCRLLKTFVVVIGKSEHEAARRILM